MNLSILRKMRRLWDLLGPVWQDRMIDAAAAVYDCLLGWYAAVLYCWTVYLANGVREPIRLPAGQSVILVAAQSDWHLRLLAHFWRNERDHTCAALSKLIPAGAWPVVVSGVVVTREDGIPLSFRATIDPGRSTLLLTHLSTNAAACHHTEIALTARSAALTTILAPLVGRRACGKAS